MEHIKEITVDLSGGMYFNYITAVQGDEKSRFVKITILSGGLPFSPPEEARAVLRCKKPDRTFVLNDATIGEDGVITAELTENMLAAVGICRCEITLYKGESSLTTVPFIVKVTPGAVNPQIESTDEYTALTNALAQVRSALDAVKKALEYNQDVIDATLSEIGRVCISEIVIPAAGWTKQEDDEYGYSIDVQSDKATSKSFPDIALYKSARHTAENAGLCPTVEALDGRIRFWAKNIPESDMPATMVLLTKGNGVTVGSGEAYELPIATATQLGGIKIGDGINIKSDGTASVGATAEAIDRAKEMIDSVFQSED